jgi:uncharacterized membrane protein
MKKITITLAVLALAAATTAARADDNMLILAGLGSPLLMPSALFTPALGLTPQYSYLARLQTGWALDVPFPKKLAGLAGNDLVVLADVPGSALSGLMGRRTLRQFVERGEGLLYFGGPFGLGKGEVAGSAFEVAMPVITTGPWDMVKADNPVVKVATASPITAGLHWDQKPTVGYYQKVTVRPGAQVLLKCGDAPVLITGTYGQGRVAVFAGTYLGAPVEGQPAFFEWSDYPVLLARLITWLTQR